MKKVIIFELKRAFHGIGMKISLLLGMMVCILDLSLFYFQYGAPNGMILIQAWIGTDYQFAYNSLFYVLMPILACLPYAGSYFTDIDSGYEKNICIRTSRLSFLIAKGIVVFVSAAFVVIFPLAVDFIAAAGLYPNHRPEKLYFLTAGIIDCNMFSRLFNQNPLLYAVLFILIDGMFAGLMGLMSVCVSKWVKSHFSAVMIPFVIYILTGVLLLNDNGYSLSVMEMINPAQRVLVRVYEMILLYVVIFFLSSFITWFWSRKRDII